MLNVFMTLATLTAFVMQEPVVPDASVTQASQANMEGSDADDPDAAGYDGLAVLACEATCLTPMDAIAEGSRLEGQPARAASYSFIVRNVGSSGRMIFINSETDYRDPRNVSVAIPPDAAREIFRRTGRTDLRRALIGQTIIVNGRARRVRIGFFDGYRRPTGEYYYQTHIPIRFGNQLGRPAAS